MAFETFHDDNTLDDQEVFSHAAVSPDPNYKDICHALWVTITDRTAEELPERFQCSCRPCRGAGGEHPDSPLNPDSNAGANWNA